MIHLTELLVELLGEVCSLTIQEHCQHYPSAPLLSVPQNTPGMLPQPLTFVQAKG